MSHLSKIQTKIHKVSTLQKTLDDLGFQYRIQFNTQQEKKNNCSTYKIYTFEF